MKYEPKYASEPGHPDYDQYMTMKGMVDKMHGENGIGGGIDMNSADMSHRASAAMLRAYKTEAVRDNASLDPKERIDGVVLSRNNDRFDDVGGRYAIMYQGDPNSPTVRTLAVSTHELTQPAERNFEEVNRINGQQLGQTQQHLQAQQQVQARQQAQDQDQPSMGSRSL
jgi:hypothetical protein